MRQEGGEDGEDMCFGCRRRESEAVSWRMLVERIEKSEEGLPTRAWCTVAHT